MWANMKHRYIFNPHHTAGFVLTMLNKHINKYTWGLLYLFMHTNGPIKRTDLIYT